MADTARRRSSVRRSRGRQCFRTGGTRRAAHATTRIPPTPRDEPELAEVRRRRRRDVRAVPHRRCASSPERHTRHAANTEASRCVSCHMPRIMEALLFQARSHEIDDMPDAGDDGAVRQHRQPERVPGLPRAIATAPGCAPALRRSDPGGTNRRRGDQETPILLISCSRFRRALPGSCRPRAAPRKRDRAGSSPRPAPFAAPLCSR